MKKFLTRHEVELTFNEKITEDKRVHLSYFDDEHYLKKSGYYYGIKNMKENEVKK